MIKIEREYNVFRVKSSEPGMGTRGFSVKARDISQVVQAIYHYFGAPKGRIDNHHANAPTKGCPLCAKEPKP